MDTASRPGACRALLLFLLLGTVMQGIPEAKEATKRGRNATIIWLDENGQQHETRGGEIRYGYFTRSLLTVPKDGRTYRDDEHLDKGLSFVQNYYKFSKFTRIDFHREKIEGSPATRLVITLKPLRGKPIVESGNTLAGSAHAKSPFIAFRVDGVERRIELLPLENEEDRGGKPQLVSADFKL